MAHHVYSNQWCYSLMINYHTPDNHQILVVRSAFIKTTWISIPQKLLSLQNDRRQKCHNELLAWWTLDQIGNRYFRYLPLKGESKKSTLSKSGCQWWTVSSEMHLEMFNCKLCNSHLEWPTDQGLIIHIGDDQRQKQWQTQTQGHLGAPSDLQTKVWSFMIETMVEFDQCMDQSYKSRRWLPALVSMLLKHKYLGWRRWWESTCDLET